MANITREPTLGTLSTTGNAVTLAYDWVTFPTLKAVQITGIAPTVQVDDPCLTSVGSVTLAGNAIEVNVANSGTSITNPNASTTRVVNINACEYSGFQAKPHELKPTHNAMVLPEFWEDEIKDRRYPRRTATATGPLRAEPVGDEVFLAVNEVSADDL